MTLSDRIAQTILGLLEQSGGQTEIKRNNLASDLGCVPSQINYVITSRFTPENGYMVVSRRGGGGSIQIRRVEAEKNIVLMHVLNSLGDSLDMASLRAMLESLVYNGMVPVPAARLILAACTDTALRPVVPELRDAVRASVAKQALMAISQE